MNFLEDPCLDVIYLNGDRNTLSVLDVISNSHNILSFDGLTPLQTFSVLRFFVAAVQASLNGPKDDEEWYKCKDFIQSKFIKYINKHTKYFNHDKFLQIENVKATDSSIRKLGLYWKEGNNVLLFEHYPSQSISEKDLFKTLLAFQNFSPLSKTKNSSSPIFSENDEKTGLSYAPCSGYSQGYLLTCIHGENLLETIWLNLITKKDCGVEWGKAIWEYKNTFAKTDLEEIRKSYLGRMIPINRSIKIVGDRCFVTNGIDYLNDKNGGYDSMMSYKDKDGSFVTMDESKHAWRSLHLLKNAPVLRNLSKSKELSNMVQIYTGGASYKKEMDCSKITNELFWTLTFPISILDDDFERYKRGIEFADFVERKLWNAINLYVKNALDNNKRVRQSLVYNAKEIYWSNLNKNHSILINNLSSQKIWQEFVVDSAQKAFRFTCDIYSSLELKGFVIGDRVLKSVTRDSEEISKEMKSWDKKSYKKTTTKENDEPEESEESEGSDE